MRGKESDSRDNEKGEIETRLTSLLFQKHAGSSHHRMKAPSLMSKAHMIDVGELSAYDLLYEDPAASSSSTLVGCYNSNVDTPTVRDSTVHAVEQPCSQSYNYLGVGNADGPDRELGYAITTLTVHG